MATYPAKYIANFVVEYANELNNPVNNLKLQKILYYIQARKLVESGGEPMFEEAIQKWKLGPVVAPVYHMFKSYGATAIKSAEPMIIEDTSSFLGFKFEPFDMEVIDDANDKEIIMKTVQTMVQYNPFDLVDFTHRHSLWKEDEDEIMRNVHDLEYDNDDIYDYFINHREEQIW
ncbi:hypothetical protein BMT55_16555 [Listeria newyorkensis]|uniref:Antitoxin SocA-like Panacea domain-containing protein n=1 Tax=Listeria newyorkensis TaxID=1497681 RepID=A0ABX4XIM8_9LIST|nr:type II toxin-antitoxin system antitoxin SocA domain-containing protein [Listeria newyorkensis]PNP87045.1 hypothetical protein BMT55_16555 [Listeria newyorkensis]